MKLAVIILILSCLGQSLFGQVDFASKQLINNTIVYQDFNNKTQFYYTPLGLKLVTDKDGKPEFKFLEMRYTGTRTSGDQGTHRFKSILSFRVSQYQPTQLKRDSIITALVQQGFIVKTLQPVTLNNLKAKLIHAADTIYGGFFENRNSNSNFVERDFTLRLSPEDAQLLSDSFENQQPTLSVNYQFSTKGYNDFPTELSVTKDPLTEGLSELIKKGKDSVNHELSERIIYADALQITIDTNQWPYLIQQIDINERIPPEYAAIDLYCFDFNNEMRPDLYAKRIDIKAEGVGGSSVTFRHTFKFNEPDQYAKTLKFIYAVKLDQPYEYRITEVLHDGTFKRHQWQIKDSWNEILDVTTKQKL